MIDDDGFSEPCCTYASWEYLADGAVDVNRWTPVYRRERLTITDEYGVSPERRGMGTSCGDVFMPLWPLRPSHTYTVQAEFLDDAYSFSFTTGESDDHPELVVEVGEDQNPSSGFRADLTFNRAPAVATDQDRIHSRAFHR